MHMSNVERTGDGQTFVSKYPAMPPPPLPPLPQQQQQQWGAYSTPRTSAVGGAPRVSGGADGTSRAVAGVGAGGGEGGDGTPLPTGVPRHSSGSRKSSPDGPLLKGSEAADAPRRLSRGARTRPAQQP